MNKEETDKLKEAVVLTDNALSLLMDSEIEEVKAIASILYGAIVFSETILGETLH